MEQVILAYHDETYVRVRAEPSIMFELSDRFTFDVPGAKFMPSYKNKVWDGRIKLLNVMSGLIYAGLIPYIEEFCAKRDYECMLVDFPAADSYTDTDIAEYVANLGLPEDRVPRWFQHGAFKDAINRNRGLYLSPTACHAAGDKVLMANGFYKNIEDIVVGERVIGADGLPKEVLRTYRGEDEMYHIIPRNNKSRITVTKNHILPLRFSDYSSKYGYTKGKADEKVFVTVEDYLNKSVYFKHCSNIIYNQSVIQFDQPVNIETKLTPYFIGIYLGDGSSYRCSVTTGDETIVNEINSTAISCGMTVKHTSKYGYHLVGASNRKNRIFFEFEKFGLYFSGKKRMSCHERFIPSVFFRTHEDFRKELLAGLIDSDGTLDNNTSFVFTSKSQQLASDVALLSTSLGLSASVNVKHNKKYKKDYYNVRICGEITKIPVRIPRKGLIKDTKKNSYNIKFDVSYAGVQNFYGLEVEDHLYITNDGMITHNSGKSLIIYMLSQFYEGNVLIIVPTTGLVHQMANDFTSYNCDPDHIHKVFSGQEKFTNKKYTITTWQSIYKLPKSWFNKYSIVIGDEAHLFKASSLTSIMGKLGHCRYRFGFTGTLDGTQTNKLVLEGLFGKVYEVTTTSELMTQGYVADLKIKNIVLKHSEENRKFIKGQTYAQEMDFICTYRPRNIILRNLAIAQKGNTLLLFNYVDKHGKVLDQMIRDAVPDRPVFYIHGGVKGEIREEMRQEIATLNNAIIIASYGTLSTGVNIPSIENLIFGSPMKSRIRNLQSIGRSLRLSEGKEFATLYDVSDDLAWKSKSNHTLRHFVERVKIYNEQNLKYKTYYIEVK